MTELLHATDVPLGLVTNGERTGCSSTARPGEATSFVTWYAALWIEEPLTLRAFRTLLGVRRFFGVPPAEDARRHARRKRAEPAGGHRPARPTRCAARSRCWSRPLDRIDHDLQGRAPRGRRREGALRSRAHRDDAARLPLLRRGARAAPARRPALRPALRASRRCATSCARRPTSMARKLLERPARRLVPPARHLPRASTAASNTTTCACLRYGGSAVRSRPLPVPRRPRGRHDAGATPRLARCRSTTAPCCTCSRPSRSCRCACRAVASGAAAPELPRARHRADRPCLRGPARPHRPPRCRHRARPALQRERGQGDRARRTRSSPARR